MKIDIWGDFACPFCYMGETRLDRLMESQSSDSIPQITFHAYELDPNAPLTPTQSMTQHFKQAHDLTELEAEQRIAHIVRLASHLDLDINLMDTKVCSTMDAHRLMKYAATLLDQSGLLRLNFALFKANFVDNKCLSDRQVLMAIAEQAGLDSAGVSEMLASGRYVKEVRDDEEELERTDFEYIPYMKFEDGTVLQGAISAGDLKKALGLV